MVALSDIARHPFFEIEPHDKYGPAQKSPVQL
jgi:hypothetical protein